jgi:cytochrome o ubiquinol oxidase operon protein cyoD
MAEPSTRAAPAMRSYLVGLVLALVLTALPFALVAAHALSRTATLAVIAAAALVQVLVHLRFFLHLGLRRSAPETLATVAFAAVLIGIMFGGTLWIMFDLNRRMDVGQAVSARTVADAAPPVACRKPLTSASCAGSR